MKKEYEDLIERFVGSRIAAGEFEKLFLKKFKNEPPGIDPKTFDVLDKLFSDIDSYSPDCEEGEESAFEISEGALRRGAIKALEELRQLPPS